jgi:hypothetical protein
VVSVLVQFGPDGDQPSEEDAVSHDRINRNCRR